MAPEVEGDVIPCGWCGNATEPGTCSTCGRDAHLPWTQRAMEPPAVKEDAPGRPSLDVGQIRQRIRIARRELPADATNAQLAAHLGISERTLGRWQQKVAD